MLLETNDHGIYCEKGGFYIDPWKPVERAVITHAHADHARWGSRSYLAHRHSEPILRLRLGKEINLQTLRYGEKIVENGVKISLHPAGHIIGSAQVRVEHCGEVWVVSGDYKLENDGLCTPFEAVTCHHFITESTFGLPIYRWKPQTDVFQEINDWWKTNQEMGVTSILFAYALGKAQRLLNGLNPSIGKIFVHGAVWNVLEAYKALHKLPYLVQKVEGKISKQDYEGAMVVAPPSALGSAWMNKFRPFVTGFASGWMTVRGMKRRRAVDRGFVISDHADWPGLLQAVKDTKAENVWVTHGYTDTFSRFLYEQGWNAQPLETLYEGEGDSPST